MKFASLMYHQIADNPKGKFWVSKENFLRQLDWLVENGFKSIDLSAEAPFAEDKCVLITFDDGHKSNLWAARELSQRGFKGIFYIIKNKSLQDADYLNESDLMEIAKLGHLLGVHGKDHKWWTEKSKDLFVSEFTEVSNWLESLTGVSVVSCSAPGGFISPRVVLIINEIFPNVKYIRSSIPSYNDNRLEGGLLRSVAICRNTTMDDFKKIVRMDKVFYSCEVAFYYAKVFIKKIVYRY